MPPSSSSSRLAQEWLPVVPASVVLSASCKRYGPFARSPVPQCCATLHRIIRSMFSIPDALYCRCVEAAVFGAVSANACPTALSSVTETAIRVSHFLRCTQPTTPTPIVSRATRRRQRKKEGTCVSVSGDHGSLTVGAVRTCPTPVSISASAFAIAHSEFESPEKRDIMRCDIFSARDEGEPIVWSTLRHVFGHWARSRASHHELPPRKLEASPPGTDDGF